MIHHWLGWLSLAICISLLMKYIGRISKNKNINQLLRKFHSKLGVAVIAISLLHGIICVLKVPEATIQIITGLILWVLIVCLASTFYARVKLKAKWFQTHRLLALLFCGVMIVHVVISIL